MTAIPFGKLLADFRQERRLSQSSLAERADFSHSYISRLEGGTRQATREAVERLAGALTLTRGERGMLLQAAGFTAQDDVDEALQPIAVLLRQGALPPGKREALIRALRGLAGLAARDLLTGEGVAA
jgi:transcriptional regulator with XRE-family HTH domain